MVDLIGEGRVDLNVRFTFSITYLSGLIADNSNREEIAASDTSWIGDEPLETVSSFRAGWDGGNPFLYSG